MLASDKGRIKQLDAPLTPDTQQKSQLNDFVPIDIVTQPTCQVGRHEDSFKHYRIALQ